MNFFRSNSRVFERVLLLLTGTLIGIGGYVLTTLNKEVGMVAFHQLREDKTNYRLIDPLLACDSSGGDLGDKYTELEHNLINVVNDEKEKGNADNVSLYFRELPGGRWVGIDENHPYDPASLLKIALMITYFKEAEEHPDVITQSYLYTKSLDLVDDTIPFAATSSLRVGKNYTVKQLINAMITESDNGATFTLLDHVNQGLLSQVYKDLHIPSPESVKGRYTISAKEYSLFFRILFNATYLDRESSEEAMQLLTQSTYGDGIIHGISPGTVVAHKFGEHVSKANGGGTAVELHDCGIVYGPNLPYFLCVMTSGSSVDKLSGVIERISRTVYQAVDVGAKN